MALLKARVMRGPYLEASLFSTLGQRVELLVPFKRETFEQIVKLESLGLSTLKDGLDDGGASRVRRRMRPRQDSLMASALAGSRTVA
ncbi:MAG TPA: hypothetical protein VGM00_05015 [Bradyrhizobium sp.]|jgi:hypothetical protein